MFFTIHITLIQIPFTLFRVDSTLPFTQHLYKMCLNITENNLIRFSDIKCLPQGEDEKYLQMLFKSGLLLLKEMF